MHTLLPVTARVVRRLVLPTLVVAMAGWGLAVVPATGAGAVTAQPQGWSTAKAPLPSNAAASPIVEIASTTCPAPGQCIAVGSYESTTGFRYGLIETLSNGVWTGMQAPEPANAGTEGDGHQSGSLGISTCGFSLQCQAVTCPSSSVCYAVGTYADTAGNTFGLIEALSNGTWTASTAPAPANAGTGADQGTTPVSVTCTSTTSCVVIGQYRNTSDAENGLIDTMSGSTWTALEAPVPADAQPESGANAALLSISCPTSTSCVAVGEYKDGSAKQNTLVDTLSGSTWAVAHTTLPANSGTDGNNKLNAFLFSVSCPAPGQCVAVGEYADTGGNVLGLIDTLSGGAWIPLQAPMPADFANSTSTSEPVLASVSCPTSTWCVAVGTYHNTGGHLGAVIDTLSGGHWTAAGAPVPANAGTGANQDAFLFAVACPTVGFCLAGGSYEDSTTGLAGLVDTWSGGSWSGAAAVLPTGVATGSGEETLAFGISCSSPVDCGLVGTYNDSSGHQQAFLDTLTGVQGYWLAASDGGIFTFGNAQFFGSTGAIHLNKPIVGMAATPDGQGYWLVATDGGVFSFGDAQFHGSTGAITLNKPIVGMTPTPDGKGYWLVASDGGIFSFGDAAFHGSTGAIILNKPIVGMASTPSGQGYWLVATDGGIFSFGDATFFGSTGAIHLNKPIVGMGATPNGDGYWLVASDGGIFTFGAGTFYGSTGAITLNKPIVGMASSPSGHGYWLVATDGGIFSFGDALFYGSTGALVLNKPIVGMAAG